MPIEVRLPPPWRDVAPSRAPLGGSPFPSAPVIPVTTGDAAGTLTRPGTELCTDPPTRPGPPPASPAEQTLELLPRLNPRTVAAALGPYPAAAAVVALKAEVRGAIQRFRDEVATGELGRSVLTVRGRPLAEYLDLDTIARLLRATPEAQRLFAALARNRASLGRNKARVQPLDHASTLGTRRDDTARPGLAGDRPGVGCEICVPWLPSPPSFVLSEREIPALLAEGVTRGRIWTAVELSVLLSLLSPSQAVQRLIEAKLEFDGDITDVEKPATPSSG